MPGVNKGEDIAIYESIHGSAPDIAGKNLANPIALLLTFALLLDDIKENDKADKLRKAIYETLKDKENYTKDLGGSNTTTGITEAIINNLGD